MTFKKANELTEALAAAERERDEWRERCIQDERDLAIAGVRGSPPPGQEATIPMLLRQRQEAERERDTLAAKVQEMRSILQLCDLSLTEQGEPVDRAIIKHALSSDCGREYVPKEELREANEKLDWLTTSLEPGSLPYWQGKHDELAIKLAELLPAIVERDSLRAALKECVEALSPWECETCQGKKTFVFECPGCLTGESECTCDLQKPEPCPQCQGDENMKAFYAKREQALAKAKEVLR